MHSLAWDDSDDERTVLEMIAKSNPGKVVDLPTPPDHIIVDIKPQPGTQWPKHLNLAPDSNFICIPIGLTSWCDKKAKVGTQESVGYYAHAVDLAFAITVWKSQVGTFEYIIALLEHSPGSPPVTFKKLYIMFTRVKKPHVFDVCHFLQDTTSLKFLPQNGRWTFQKMAATGNHGHPILPHCPFPKYPKLLQHANCIRQPNYHELPQTKLLYNKQ